MQIVEALAKERNWMTLRSCPQQGTRARTRAAWAIGEIGPDVGLYMRFCA